MSVLLALLAAIGALLTAFRPEAERTQGLLAACFLMLFAIWLRLGERTGGDR